MSELCLNLPTDTFLCEAEKGNISLVYRRLKMSDGRSMFQPLKQDRVKRDHVYSDRCEIKGKDFSLCLSCMLHNTPENPIRTSLKPCLCNTALAHQMAFKGGRYVPSRHCPLALSQHVISSSKRQGAGAGRNANNLADC